MKTDPVMLSELMFQMPVGIFFLGLLLEFKTDNYENRSCNAIRAGRTANNLKPKQRMSVILNFLLNKKKQKNYRVVLLKVLGPVHLSTTWCQFWELIEIILFTIFLCENECR